MATNARGQKIIAGTGEPVTRARINGILDDVLDIRPVANLTARAQLLADLTAAPGQTPAPGRPLYVHRADAPTGHRLEFTEGTTFTPVIPFPIEFVATKGARQVLNAQAMTDILTVALPASAPAGVYRLDVVAATASGVATTHFIEVKVGSTTLNAVNIAIDGAANVTTLFPWAGTFIHNGGAATITLRAQVNLGPANARENTQIAVSYRGAPA